MAESLKLCEASLHARGTFVYQLSHLSKSSVRTFIDRSAVIGAVSMMSRTGNLPQAFYDQFAREPDGNDRSQPLDLSRWISADDQADTIQLHCIRGQSVMPRSTILTNHHPFAHHANHHHDRIHVRFILNVSAAEFVVNMHPVF